MTERKILLYVFWFCVTSLAWIVGRWIYDGYVLPIHAPMGLVAVLATAAYICMLRLTFTHGWLK